MEMQTLSVQLAEKALSWKNKAESLRNDAKAMRQKDTYGLTDLKKEWETQAAMVDQQATMLEARAKVADSGYLLCDNSDADWCMTNSDLRSLATREGRCKYVDESAGEDYNFWASM